MRVLRIVGGFLLLGAGVVMLVTPGPGWLAIFGGLGLLTTEYAWARRIQDRLNRQMVRWKLKRRTNG